MTRLHPQGARPEDTYQQNLTDPDDIARAIASLAEQVVKDIAAEGRPCMRVHLKVRFAPFFTVARSRKGGAHLRRRPAR